MDNFQSWSDRNGTFWSAIAIAVPLVVAKGPVAMLRFHQPTPPGVRLARERMLIAGNVLLTMIVGVVSLLLWLGLAGPTILSWPHLPWRSIWGFVIGAAFHFH